MIRRLSSLIAILAISCASFGVSAKQARKHVTQIAAQIQKADYMGDRTALQNLFGDLGPFVEDKHLASRVRYWRGFAMWRRSINGANESIAPAELDADLKKAIDEFRLAASTDPAFVDPKIAAASCLLFRVFLNHTDTALVRELVPDALEQLKQAEAAAPDNPRLLWVQGANDWYLSTIGRGEQSKAFSTYQRGLESARKGSKPNDPLDPAWGEPELLMSLSWSSLHKTEPDVTAAEQYARSALALVPYWHYVKDILLQQIQESKKSKN